MMRTAVFGAVLALSLISVFFLPFTAESVAGRARDATASIPPWTVTDDFSADSGYWNFVQTVVNIDTGTSYPGSAYRDPANNYLVLTENVNHQAGVVWLTRDVPLSFTIEFKYKVGGGSGADGFVFMFGKDKHYDPYDGGGLGFVTPPGGSGGAAAVPGYGIEFDNWLNGENNDPSANHIALIKDQVNNHLSSVGDARTEDNQWHSVAISVGSSLVEVYLDGGLVLTWEGTIDRSYGGLGFSASTATANNWHIIDDVTIVAEAPIYIRADGSIDPSSALIETADHVTYTLKGNVYDPIVVERDNIVIDGSKNWIDGAGVDIYGSKGIDLSGRRHVVVRNTQIRNFYYGIYLDYSVDNLVQDNNMTDNLGDGIKISYSSGNSIVGNNITENSDGIGLVVSDDSRVIENNVFDNTYSGIYLWRSANNRLVWNAVDRNNLGIWIGESANNVICHNNFTDNIHQSSIYASGYYNVWNNAYPAGGNYWSDYTIRYPDAEELDNSGLWNTPYVMDANNQDNFPSLDPCLLTSVVKSLAEACIYKPYETGSGARTKGWYDGGFAGPEEVECLDCSGLIYWSYNKAYCSTKYSPWNRGESYIVIDKKEVSFENPMAFEGALLQYWKNCQPVNKESLITGDLLFFDTDEPDDPDHVAMYVGGPFPFEYGDGEVFMYNTVEATIWGDAIVTVAFFDATAGYLTTLMPSTGGLRTPLKVDYFGRVGRYPIGLTYGEADLLRILVRSPVRMVVTDPEGFTVTSELCESSNMVYLESDPDRDGELDDVVLVLGRKTGDYFIGLVPKPGAAPEDSYTLEVSSGNTTIVMAQNVSIADVPSNPYIVTSNETDIIPRLDPHDIGVTGLDAARNVVGEGFSLHGRVKIFNYGSFAEIFNITVYANTSVIAEFVDVSLASRNSTTAIFAWNTADFAKGSYTIMACVTPVANETVTMDNTLLDDSEIRVTIPGDVNGDRDVDIFDIVSMAGIYGDYIPPVWPLPSQDIDGDGDVDIFDIVIAAGNYGKNW